MSFEMLADFHFLRPQVLLLLLGLPLLWWLRGRRRTAADPWRAVVDAPLLAAQASATGAGKRRADVLLMLGIGIAVLALAGPACRQLPTPLLKLQAPLILALDLSPSVRSGDLKPDRLSRARLKLAELVRRRSDGQTGLLVFAGDAFTVAPLTDDATTLDGLLAALDPSILPVPGQRPERAIRRGMRLLVDAGASRGDLLLLTDRAGSAAVDAAADARRAGLRVSVLGLGTPEGAPVAVGGGGFMRDEAGNIRLPRLDEPSLRALAEAGGGRYARFSADDADLAALGLDQNAASGAIEVDSSAGGLRYQDEGPLLLLLLLPIAALAARRGWLLVLTLAVLQVPQPGYAQPANVDTVGAAPQPTSSATSTDAQAAPGALRQFWDDLWSRRDRQAWDALQRNEPARAAELARDRQLRGSAAYRAGDYEAAAAEFAQADHADAHYNRGNALARLQRYPEALAAYEEALSRDPDHADASSNRDAVKAWLEQQPDPQPGESGEAGEQGEQSDGEQGQSDAQGEGQPDSGEPGESGQQGQPLDAQAPDPQPGDAEDPSQDESGESNSSADPGQADSDAQKDQDQQAFNEAMQEALQQSGAEPEHSSAEPVSAEAMAESERQQAIEQLLRRVPDDPGGLLRRKFLLEYQRRQREGEQ